MRGQSQLSSSRCFPKAPSVFETQLQHSSSPSKTIPANTTYPRLRLKGIGGVLMSVYTMDEPENSRHKGVNTKIDDQFAPDGKDDVVDVKEGLASQTYDSLRMLTKEDVLQMKFNLEDDAYTFYNAYAKVISFSIPSTQTHLPTEIEIEIELDWILKMGISKIEINLRRLLAAASHQQNQAKLIHYVATLREQLEQLAEERTSDGLPRSVPSLGPGLNPLLGHVAATGWVFPQKVANRLDKSMAKGCLTSKASESVLPETLQPISVTSVKESPSKAVGESSIPTSPGLRRRFVAPSNIEDRPRDSVETDYSAPVKLDAAARTHIDKHRKLQDDLTDEMVGLAQQLKESSLMMSQSLQNTEKILDSTEQAVEQSLASTGRANVRAMDIYSKSFKTTCFTWLLIFVMTCIFIMVVLLIRVT
ncbi:hypothetical protein HYC85_028650 [Camellia sinensis]|uniref:Uncharacterized protein n=1 Tax=Camellia sinensis TaxID=4442 RepID=A0A7J7FW00_CAMSI|nr:hypothetical protein HYC85_028650 [Camellia sinensis]